MPFRPRPPSIVACAAFALTVAVAVAGTGCDGNSGVIDSGEPNPYDEAAELCVDAINDHRASVGLAPYSRWLDAEDCSNGQAKSDAATGAAHGAFGTCGESAQNECPGWAGPPEAMIGDCLSLMWSEGPGDDFTTHGHYINMTSTAYTTVSCGFFVTESGAVWSVQNFK
ncbi:MAG: hypothetical protein R3B70_11635 [Polyangiaceae bacterium]